LADRITAYKNPKYNNAVNTKIQNAENRIKTYERMNIDRGTYDPAKGQNVVEGQLKDIFLKYEQLKSLQSTMKRLLQEYEPLRKKLNQEWDIAESKLNLIKKYRKSPNHGRVVDENGTKTIYFDTPTDVELTKLLNEYNSYAEEHLVPLLDQQKRYVEEYGSCLKKKTALAEDLSTKINNFKARYPELTVRVNQIKPSDLETPIGKPRGRIKHVIPGKVEAATGEKSRYGMNGFFATYGIGLTDGDLHSLALMHLTNADGWHYAPDNWGWSR
jgi:hypothetical protein